MNKVLLISFLLLSSQYIHAQPEQGSHEIMISYGLESGRQLKEWSNYWGGVHASPVAVVNGSSGNYFISYKYFVYDLYAVGISAGIQTISGDVEDNNNASNFGWYELKHSNIAVEWTPIYRCTAKFSIYGTYGLGVSFNSTSFKANPNAPVSLSDDYFGSGTYNGHGWNFQITPIGIQYGGKLACFIELGFGYKGILNGGIAYRLQHNGGSQMGKWWH